MKCYLQILCRDAEIGRQAGLRIQCPQGRAGSIPVLGTQLPDQEKTKYLLLHTLLVLIDNDGNGFLISSTSRE